MIIYFIAWASADARFSLHFLVHRWVGSHILLFRHGGLFRGFEFRMRLNV